VKAPTTKQLIERWENVLRVLRALTPHQRRKHWNMETWGTKTECGTVACAAGHCAMDSWFRRRGFKYGKHLELIMFAPDFFGHEGTNNIFYNTEPRSVGQVIKEVRAHIKELKQ
jgi:hypothetical protein